MIIEAIKLHGWRSYDSDGICINGLKSINLIIGPNNAGKSNLSKYFHYLKSISDENKANEGMIAFKTQIEESQTWNWSKEDICCEISLSRKNIDIPARRIDYKSDEHRITLSCRHAVQDEITVLNCNVDDKPIFDQGGRIYEVSNRGYVDASDEMAGFYDNSSYWTSFLDSLVFIDPIRHHSRNSGNEQIFYFDGAMIIKELSKLQNNHSNTSKWVNFKRRFTAWLSGILSEEVSNIEILEDKVFRLEFKSHCHLALTLDKLGTGVSQIVMLLAYLWINKDKKLNVFLDEPEASLHPDSVIKLVNIFEKELSNHTFFITTHSPSLIDCLNENWTVFRTSKSENGASKMTANNNIIKHYETLDALGVKASQILQSNTVIWVEGPSDRIYIKKWIDIFSNNELIEGKDFSFLYFGGTNLSSFTITDDLDQHLINMLSTSRKAYLITDSDCSSQEERDNEEFKTYLNLYLDRLTESDNRNSGLSTSTKDYFKIWVADGREIENYIPKGLLFSVLTEKGFKRDSIGKGSDKKNLCLAITQESDFIFENFNSFDKAIAECYQYADNTSLTPSAKDNVALSYARKKVPIARRIIEKWEKEHTVSISKELSDRLKELIAFIKR